MPTTPIPREKPAGEIEITGVVRAIALDTDRVTIAYDAVDGLGWPAGTMPFVVAKSALLKDVTVGEKVRFRSTASRSRNCGLTEGPPRSIPLPEGEGGARPPKPWRRPGGKVRG